MKCCASHKVKLSVPPTPAGTSRCEASLHARSALLVPQGTLSSKKPDLSGRQIRLFCWRRWRDLSSRFAALHLANIVVFLPASVGILLICSLAFARFIRHRRRSQRSLSRRTGAVQSSTSLQKNNHPDGWLFFVSGL